MVKDETLNRIITEKLKLSQREFTHGKLSGSMLGWPLQWQVLKTTGHEPRQTDDYTLRKFERGKHVEAWVMENLPGVLTDKDEATQRFIKDGFTWNKTDKQWEFEYRGVVGHIDALVDTKGYETNVGIIPFEIKSVGNMKFTHVLKNGNADDSHLWQACFYAIACKSDYFAIIYVSTDDYRITCTFYKAADYAKQVLEIIHDYELAMKVYKKMGTTPKFMPRFAWQSDPKYNMYPTMASSREET